MSEKTMRQQWLEYAADLQTDVNETLDDLRVDIALANEQLKYLYGTDPEQAGDFAEEIVGYLDEAWGFTGDRFLVTGKWWQPVTSISSDGIQWEKQKTDTLCAGAISNGFVAAVLPDETGEEYPVIGLSFIVESVQLGSAFAQGEVQLLAFAEPDEISLQYLRHADADVVSSDVSEVATALSVAEAMLQLYTSHHASTFYRANPKKRQALLRSLVKQIEDTLPVPETADVLSLEDAQVSVVRFNKLFPDGRLEKMTIQPSSADQPIILTGTIIGVDIPGANDPLDRARTVMTDPDIAKEGIVLIIRPSRVNFDIPGVDMDNAPIDLEVPVEAIVGQLSLALR